ncbi:MAG TPA: hypothetical protein VF649_01500 [Sphingomonas sp.]|uniref:hypothetical protein n=1 Tax=Sphingomonas sp. TaxID=28214 RepID=UPI002ED7CA73
MDLDALLHHYFGTAELDRLDPATIADGCERARLALGLEAEPGRRFALWMLLHALDAAPDPSVVFKDAKARRIAEDYARAAARATEG